MYDSGYVNRIYLSILAALLLELDKPFLSKEVLFLYRDNSSFLFGPRSVGGEGDGFVIRSV